MGLDARGGFPFVRQYVVPTAGAAYDAPFAVTKQIDIENAGSGALRVYFTEADFDADANYVAVAASGSRSMPAEVRRIWMKAITLTAAVTVVFYERR